MRVVICGAGIAGLALAGRLHNVLGWEVVVLEKAPQPRTEGYMIDFFGPGRRSTNSRPSWSSPIPPCGNSCPAWATASCSAPAHASAHPPVGET
ncbi:NAD(P)-binding protein, partial [Streptomyces broussonetiae]